jgi:cell division protease FtsH
MSDLGPLTFGERDDLIFLGRDLAVNKNFSERTSERIDDEVKKIIMRSYNRTQELMEANRDKLVKIAALLLEKEALSSDEINAIVDGKKKKVEEDGTPFLAGEAGAGAVAAEPAKGPGES